MKNPALACAFVSVSALLAIAQTTAIEINKAYQCPGETTFKVLSCAGSGSTDMCEVESVALGRTRYPGKSTRADIMTLLRLCHVQTPQEAQTATINGALGKDFNGFSVREPVRVNTSQGWRDAMIVAMNGNDYRVVFPDGFEAVKLYPIELRRVGPFTARDRALGLFNLKERVQVVLDGKVEIGEITSVKGMDYEVQLSRTRFVWANGRVLLLAPEAPAPGLAAGTPPKPDATICPAAIEGRYVPTGPTGLVVEFRSGTALVRALNGNDHSLECWMSGGKIILHRPGDSNADDLTVDINSDGSLKTPFGEVTRPPKPGLTSCAGEIEGRYQPLSAAASPVIEFRSGKALVGESKDFLQCWMDTEKIHLHRPGELAKSEMTMDINPDGSLKTPLGEIGKPPKAGLRSCAGTIEGRYVSRGTGGGPAIEFRSGKALVRTLDGKEHSLPCWMGDGKIYLYKPGRLTGDDMTIDVISSAVLRTPFGEILKQ